MSHPSDGRHRAESSEPNSDAESNYDTEPAEDGHGEYAGASVHTGGSHAAGAHRGAHAADDQHYVDGSVLEDTDGLPLLDQGPRRARRRARPPAHVRRRRTFVVIGALALVTIASIVLYNVIAAPVLARFQTPDYPGPGHGSAVVTIEQGATNTAIGATLVEAGVIRSTRAFTEAVQEKGGNEFVQPGEYELREEMSASDALDALLDTEANAVHYAAIAQGQRQNEVFETLAKATGRPVSDFSDLVAQRASFGLPAEAPSFEGYLHPGEYRFARDLTPTQILTEMIGNTKEALEKQGITEPDEQYRILTIASIIEAEAGKADYHKVSGAIYNRLSPDNTETGGRIDSDATVTYGLDRRSYELTNAEKLDASNKYNTFANPGLPVGPIGSPDDAAIEAAKNPEDVDYYYWVTINLKTGETLYAKTLAQHNENVKLYTQWCDANPGTCQ